LLTCAKPEALTFAILQHPGFSGSSADVSKMENSEITILLVDDEPDILEFLGYNLEREGYNVLTAKNGQKGLKLAVEKKPQLVILDVMMPVMDGMETCTEIRKNPELADTLVAFLTARGEDYSQIAGFDAGADDYITKPIKPKVFISRVQALLRRIKEEPEDANIVHLRDFTIDKSRYLVVKNNKEINLVRKEFELLQFLVTQQGKVVTRDEIFESVWGDNVIVGDRTIDVHIRRIREKLDIDSIKTVKGVGYKFWEG
jgi:two-component system alkaline phosphatase synthesis response regulator PhoP